MNRSIDRIQNRLIEITLCDYQIGVFFLVYQKGTKMFFFHSFLTIFVAIDHMVIIIILNVIWVVVLNQRMINKFIWKSLLHSICYKRKRKKWSKILSKLKKGKFIWKKRYSPPCKIISFGRCSKNKKTNSFE